MFPLTHSRNAHDEIAEKGYSVLSGDDIPVASALPLAWSELRADYQSLPPDNHLPAGASYRFRRYDRFFFLPVTGELHLLPHEAYYQAADINPVTGGTLRQFAPLLPSTADNPFLHELIRWDFQQFPLRDAEQQYNPWQVDVHEVLVVAQANQAGQPTPEGIHRDGAEFVTVHLMQLQNVRGGIVTIYDAQQQPLEQFQLQQPMDSYLFDDARLWHSVTPIEVAEGAEQGLRGILTFDYHYRPQLARPT